MNMFKLALAIVFASVLAAVGSVHAETTVFRDNFEGRTAGDPLSAALPQVGGAYTSGTARDIATSPGPAGGSIFAQDLGTETWLAMSNPSATANKVSQLDLDLWVPTLTANDGVDVISFVGPAYAGRGFDVFFHGDGSISYWAGGSVSVAAAGAFATGAWQHVAINADFGKNTFTSSIGSYSFSGTMNGAASFGSIDLYGNAKNVDNILVRVDPVPEPGTVVLLVTGRGRPAGLRLAEAQVTAVSSRSSPSEKMKRANGANASCFAPLRLHMRCLSSHVKS